MDWFEDDEFWRDLFPYMFPVERIMAAAEQVAQIVALSGIEGGHVLDLCCGPGRHSVEFARRGFQVTGVDRSEYLLERARKFAGDEMVDIELVRDDMREFRRPVAFDLAVNLFTSFGYFDSQRDEMRVLRNVCESLRPGGLFVMELMGKEYLAAHWASARCVDYADGTMMVQRARVAREWTRIFCEWTIVQDGKARMHKFDHEIYSGRELKERLLAAGFAEVRLYGSLAGTEYGVEAPRLIPVARKA